MKRLLSRLSADHLLRSSAWLFVQLLLTYALGYVYWRICTASFTPVEIGNAGAVLSVVTAIVLFANVGAGHTLIERLPRLHGIGPWSRMVVKIFAIAGVCSFVMATLVVVVLRAFPSLSSQPMGTGTSFLVVAGAAGWTLMNVTNYLFIAQRASGWTVFSGIVFQTARLCVLVVIAFTGVNNFNGIVASWSAAVLIAVCCVMVGPFRYVRAKIVEEHGEKAGNSRSLSASLGSHYVINISAALPGLLYPGLVALRADPQSSAYFQLAWSASAVMGIVSGIMGTTLFAEGIRQPDRLGRLIRKCGIVTGAALFPIAAFLVLFGGVILGSFSSVYRQQGYSLLLILVAAAFIDGINNIAVGAWRAQGNLRPAMLVSGGTAVVGIAAAWVLIPEADILGAGLAWLLANIGGVVAIVFLAGSAHLRRIRRRRFDGTDSL